MTVRGWLAVIGIIAVSATLVLTHVGGAAAESSGSLTVIEPDGKPGAACPLEHTSVNAEISGFVARVTVKQTFHNQSDKKIEAVYTFPLSASAAVDDMTMLVGKRLVKGTIKRREEARQIYERARERGHVASLLDQERPNIFTQSVANIGPGEKVEITIAYVEMLPYADGAFTFCFPMVVGPRFIPGDPAGSSGTGWARDTNQVRDASRITPPVAAKGTRAGHDIDLQVTINAGVLIGGVESKLHEISTEKKSDSKWVVSLSNKKEIPNRDFVLKYTVAGEQVRSGVLAHREGNEGYFTIVMIPPKRVKPDQVAPKEMIFVIDCSGSQRGLPLEKAKETMRYVIDKMNPDDTFNIIDFNHNARALFPEPKRNSRENREKALRYLQSLEANGGTWMGPAVEAVCKSPAAENRLRIVTFMTDGYVGNDFEIMSLVKKLRGKSRWFPFGTGNSVNRFLLDSMARVGGGEVEYILLKSPGKNVAEKFYRRIASPVLTDIAVSFDGVTVEDVYPRAVSDLWDGKPLVFKGRYTKPGKGRVTVRGFSGGKPYEQTLEVNLPDKDTGNAALASLWARAKVDDLMDGDWMGMQRGAPAAEIKEKIAKVALAHRIMTQFTSFVAVEETVVTVGGKPTRVTVPVELPDGVSREGVFGSDHAVGAVMGNKRPVRRIYEKSNYVRGVASSLPVVSGFSAGSAPAPQSAPSLKKEGPFRQEFKGSYPRERADGAWGRSKDKSPQKTSALDMKLSPELRKLVDLAERQKSAKTFTYGAIKVIDGKITVQVRLTGSSDKILTKLKETGLKIEFKASAGSTVIGNIAVEKLKDLAEISAVLFIEPVTAG
jgi:Ca-activated chloride channel homolog